MSFAFIAAELAAHLLGLTGAFLFGFLGFARRELAQRFLLIRGLFLQVSPTNVFIYVHE